MILVDSSVWIDHLRAGDDRLRALLDATLVVTHDFVIGELALGNLKHRADVLDALDDLPRAVMATDKEVRHTINRHTLFGLGIGYTDAHLLSAALLTQGVALWTRDQRLRAAAERLGVAAQLR